MSGKLGGGGRPWIPLDRPKPPPVEDTDAYWGVPPPDGPSARCLYWLRQIDRGWRPNRRLRRNAWQATAKWLGIYLWEYQQIVWPAARGMVHLTGCPQCPVPAYPAAEHHPDGRVTHVQPQARVPLAPLGYYERVNN